MDHSNVRDLLTQNKKREKLFTKTDFQVTDTFKNNYYKKLMVMRDKIYADPKLKSKYFDLLKGLDQLHENGAIILHSLRATWDTYASRFHMDPNYRKFHMNHSRGLDDTYDQLYKNEDTFKEYLFELNTKSYKFNFGEI